MLGKRDLVALGTSSCILFALGFHLAFGTLHDASRDLPGLYEAVVAGTADAPAQYRVLAPYAADWLADGAGVNVRRAAVVLDAGYLGTSMVLMWWTLRTKRLPLLLLPAAALYVGFYGMSLFRFARPEPTMAMLGTSLLVVAFLHDRSRWRWPALVAAALVLAGTRTDLLVAAAAPFAVRWWQRRRRADLLLSGALVAAGALATVLLMRWFPADYHPDVPVVMLDNNVKPQYILLLLCFFLPALAPLLSKTGRSAAGAFLPLVAMPLSQAAFTFVVGRIDEVRILFPNAWILGIVGGMAWSAVARESFAVEPEPAPAALTADGPLEPVDA